MWHSVAKTSDLREGQGISLIVPGRRKPVALFRWAGQFFAVADECSHAYFPLYNGEVRDFIVTCPAHGAQFDLRTGKGVDPMAYPELKTFPVRVIDNDVQIEI